MIQDTSLFAYSLAAQNLGAKQKKVLDALRFYPNATNAELAAKLGWPINRVTPRIKELRELGLVMDGGRRECRITGSKAHAWVAKHPVLPPAREEKTSESNPQQLL